MNYKTLAPIVDGTKRIEAGEVVSVRYVDAHNGVVVLDYKGMTVDVEIGVFQEFFKAI